MNKNTFLSTEGTVIYAQLRLFPFDLIRTWQLRKKLYLLLLQILQSVFPLGGLFIYNNTLEVLLPDSEIVSHVLEREAVSAFSRMWLRLLYYNVVLF